MTVLTKREVWRRAAPLAVVDRADLTEAERVNLSRALRFLRVRVGSGEKLAAHLRVCRRTLDRAIGAKGRPSVDIALRAARLAGVTVEMVLSGAWPAPEACPHCGRG